MIAKRKYRKSNNSKYNNVKTILDGIEFASKKEANRYYELSLLQKTGYISNLLMQVPFVLQEAYKNSEGKAITSIKYIADFVYFDNKTGHKVIEDVKGKRTDVFNLKWKILQKHYPDYKYLIT